MASFIKLTRVVAGQEKTVLVNLDRVEFIEPAQGGSIVWFSTGEPVRQFFVREADESLRRALLTGKAD